MAFGAGVLISAVAFELFLEAAEVAENRDWVATGLFAGSLTFFFGDAWIDRMGGEGRKSMGGRQAGGAALAIVLGIVLDGIPESFVVGMDLLLRRGRQRRVRRRRLPLQPARGGRRDVRPRARPAGRRARIYGLWVGRDAGRRLASRSASPCSGTPSGDPSRSSSRSPAGAILTMLADTMMPEAFEKGGGRPGS